MAKALLTFLYYDEDGQEQTATKGEEVTVSKEVEAAWAAEGLVATAKPKSKKVEADDS